ncbi:hypothetical protein Tco_0190214 [Tanacetum coccineum]
MRVLQIGISVMVIENKVVNRTISSPNRSTSDIEDDFSSMNILNYTSVSPDYFPASSGSNPSTPPAILTLSPILPPSLLFNPRYFFIPEELLLPRKQIHSPSSSSTTLFNSSRNQTCNLVSPSSSVYTPTPPQVFEIEKCSDKMYLKHHEKQVKDILNYLDELYLHRIERMEEGRINGNELKTELKEIRTQIIKLQKKRLGQKDKIAFAHYRISNLERIIEKIQARYHSYYVLSSVDRMPPKRTSTSAAPAMTQDAIRQLVADSVATALKAQAANMANTDNTNKNTRTSGTPIARKGINNHKRNFQIEEDSDELEYPRELFLGHYKLRILFVDLVVIAIVEVVIVVVFGIVVVVGGVSSIFKLSFVIVDSFSCNWRLVPVFLLVLLVFAIDAAYAFRAEEMPSLISCRMAAKVIAGVSDVDVLLEGILSTEDNT